MRKANTKTNSIKISERTKRLYEQRDKRLDRGDAPQLPPEVWAKATIGKYYRPIKTAVSVRLDNDVLDWLKSQGPGYQTRINSILREKMTSH